MEARRNKKMGYDANTTPGCMARVRPRNGKSAHHSSSME
jgi:hypothetical protein